MKKKLISDREEDVKWLQWGANKLRALLSAGFAGVKRLALEEELLVTLRAGGEGTVEVLRVPSSHYFGYGEKLPAPCRCRGVQMQETTSTQRSAVFLSDGTELASAPITVTDDGTYIVETNKIIGTHGWRGDNTMQLWRKDTREVGGYSQREPDVMFTVPDDACYEKRAAPTYPLSVTAIGWTEEWAAAQKIALEREHKRRKKCSAATHMYLRNGFLQPGLETLTKTKHPVSAKTLRTYPMQVVTYSKNVESTPPDTAIDNAPYRTSISTTTIAVTLKYTTKEIIDGAEKDVDHTETFTGTLREESWRYTRTSDGSNAEYYWTKQTAVNYPSLGSQLAATYGRGRTDDVNGALSPAAYWHDNGSNPLFEILNGTKILSGWKADDLLGTPNYPVSTPEPQSSYDFVYNTPKFVLDYIAVSKPVAAAVATETTPAKVASTNWLSSRIAHGEKITLLPLSYVHSDGERGMYPYTHVADAPDGQLTKLRIRGYATFSYDYYAGALKFLSWTEFTTKGAVSHAGDAAYNDEVEPTEMTVEGTTYTLAYKEFDRPAETALTSCVAIADRAVWEDTLAAYKTQKIKSSPSYVGAEGEVISPDNRLYAAIKKALSS